MPEIDSKMAPIAVENNVIKPIFDENKYRSLILSNKLRVLLVSDDRAEISGAVLSVFVGYQHDPENLNGLAHFLEHMLFLGSKKYPDPFEFDNYVKQNGGSMNAHTDYHETSYYFDVNSESLEGVLDRFSGFFVCPLFDTTYVEREVNAVNSEHEMNLLYDLFIKYHIISSSARSGHPVSKFGTGSLQTLKIEPEEKGIDVIKELKEFHNKYYCSGIMCLTLISNHSLDTLQEYVTKYFSDITNKGASIPNYFDEFEVEKPYLSIKDSPKDGSLGSVIYIVPNKNERSITLNYQFPDIRKFKRESPELYFLEILGHEGHGSLTSILRRNGLCYSLSSGLNEMFSANLFEITIKLTEKGYLEINRVIEYTLNYVNLMVEKDIDMDIVSDIVKLKQIIFDYKNRPSIEELIGRSTFLVANNVPLNEVLSYGNRIERIDIEAVKMLKKYFSPDNMFIVFSFPENKVMIEDKRYAEELIYDRHYKLNYLKQEFYSEIKNIINNVSIDYSSRIGLELPKKNEYIPEKLDIVNAQNKDVLSFPEQVDMNASPFTGRVKTYFKPDTTFSTPHGFTQIFFYSTKETTCETLVMDHLVSLTITKMISEEAYSAILANLDCKIIGGFSLNNSFDSISITLSGFNDKTGNLLQFIVNSIINLKNDSKSEYISFFNEAVEETKEKVGNSLYNPSRLVQLTLYNFKEFYSNYTPSKESILKTIDSVNYQKLCNYAFDFFSNCIIRSVILGNFNMEEVHDLMNIVLTEQLLGSNYNVVENTDKLVLRTCIDVESSIKGDTKIHSNNLIFSKPVLNPVDKNGAVVYTIDMGRYNLRNMVLLDLLSKYLDVKCFHELRTNQQLGYVVKCSSFNLKPVIGINIIVQSPEYSNILVINRIDRVIQKLLDGIDQSMSEEEFNSYVESEIKIYSNKPKNLEEEMHTYLVALTNGDNEFDWKQKAIKILKELSYSEFKSFVGMLLERPKIIVQSISVFESKKNREGLEKDYIDNKYLKIDEFSKFKDSKEAEVFSILT
ncbi:insulinase-like peptidase [Cryptosporidium ryanae]|uniref:insulinase-like peptidase n=1 Tax=Cryptosporidium ryanae TaxID=515981 RepID=UPI00351A4E87|nr:insulinase-like peptidase [Cryptosporidium ryanae]